MKISKEKKDKIAEQILFYLYSIYPKATFTSYIAREIARDEEFTKKILLELKKNKFILEIKKNKKGFSYSRRSRWRISNKIYLLYKSKQKSF